jgi:hypothetical protein
MENPDCLGFAPGALLVHLWTRANLALAQEAPPERIGSAAGEGEFAEAGKCVSSSVVRTWPKT